MLQSWPAESKPFSLSVAASEAVGVSDVSIMPMTEGMHTNPHALAHSYSHQGRSQLGCTQGLGENNCLNAGQAVVHLIGMVT